MQCIMVSPNLILGCQPQLSGTRLAKGQLLLDKAPRPSIRNVITYHLSTLFVSSTTYFQIVNRLAKGQRAARPYSLSARANYFIAKVQF